jgi:hypothetical protein
MKIGALPRQPAAFRAAVRMVGVSHATSPPLGFRPPFRGPVTITLTYAPKDGAGIIDRPGVVRDCKAGDTLLVCREP